MPLTITYTEGTLKADAIQSIVSQLTALMLESHGLANHPVMLPNITATVHELPRHRTFSGGQTVEGVWVEWKVPSFAFAEREPQRNFCTGATALLHAALGRRIPTNNIYVNVVHAVDGAWNFNGQPMTNQEIIAALKA